MNTPNLLTTENTEDSRSKSNTSNSKSKFKSSVFVINKWKHLDGFYVDLMVNTKVYQYKFDSEATWENFFYKYSFPIKEYKRQLKFTIFKAIKQFKI